MTSSAEGKSLLLTHSTSDAVLVLDERLLYAVENSVLVADASPLIVSVVPAILNFSDVKRRCALSIVAP